MLRSLCNGVRPNSHSVFHCLVLKNPMAHSHAWSHALTPLEHSKSLPCPGYPLQPLLEEQSLQNRRPSMTFAQCGGQSGFWECTSSTQLLTVWLLRNETFQYRCEYFLVVIRRTTLHTLSYTSHGQVRSMLLILPTLVSPKHVSMAKPPKLYQLKVFLVPS